VHLSGLWIFGKVELEFCILLHQRMRIIRVFISSFSQGLHLEECNGLTSLSDEPYEEEEDESDGI
jgi:hypothetical protein